MKIRIGSLVVALICILTLILSSCNQPSNSETKKPTDSKPVENGAEEIPTDADGHSWLDFTYDDENHWRYCAYEDCEDIADLAEHTFGEGKITTPPSPKGDGVKTFECSECGYKRTESVQYITDTTVAPEEWSNAWVDLTESKIDVKRDVYKLRFDGVWVISDKDVMVESHAVGADTVSTSAYITIMQSFKDKGASFTYNTMDNVYEAEDVKYSETTFGRVSIAFDNGKVTSFTYVSIETVDGNEYKYETRVEIDHFPTIASNTEENK